MTFSAHEIRKFIENPTNKGLEDLREQMLDAAERENYELASLLKEIEKYGVAQIEKSERKVHNQVCSCGKWFTEKKDGWKFPCDGRCLHKIDIK